MLQGGGKLKYPLSSPFHITDRRFVFRDFGRWAPFRMQMGLLFLLLVKGREVSVPLSGLVLSRGSYGMNRRLLRLASSDGRTVLLDGFEKNVEMFRAVLGDAGFELHQTGAEEWTVTAPGPGW